MYGRIGLVLTEALRLISFMGVLDGFYFANDDPQKGWPLKQAVQNEIVRVEKLFFDWNSKPRLPNSNEVVAMEKGNLKVEKPPVSSTKKIILGR